MSKAIFEVQREGTSIIIWDAGVGTRVVFPTDDLAEKNETILLTDERKFQLAKADVGVAVIEKFGELVSPFEYIQRTLKTYNSPVGRFLGIEVVLEKLNRPAQEYW